MLGNSLLRKAIVVAMFTVGASLISNRSVRTAPMASPGCIGGCCLCDYVDSCGSFGAFAACIDECGTPPASCVDNDVWDCGSQDMSYLDCGV